MSRNNDVFHLLVTKGNQAILAKDKKVTELLPGQLGVFDFYSNTSIDATSTELPKNFYLAVGVGSGANTVDIQKSAGSHIQGKNTVFYSFRPYTPGQAMKVQLKNYVADCETEYGIKLEFRNSEIYRTQGYNQFTKAYTMKTSCCKGCSPTCPSGDANEITRQLLINIANDPAGLVIGRAIARQALTAATHGVSADIAKGGVVSDANLAAMMAFNATQPDNSTFVYTDLEIETVPQVVSDFCSINLKYFNLRQTVILASKIAGFECNGTVETTQDVVFEEGAGYDVKQMEYFTKGWTDSPYRVSGLYGLANETAFVTDASAKYDIFAITYDQFSLAAWQDFLHHQASVIAIPTADTVTRDGVAAILDKLLIPQGFDTLADDATAAIVPATTVEKTTDKTKKTTGLQS